MPDEEIELSTPLEAVRIAIHTATKHVIQAIVALVRPGDPEKFCKDIKKAGRCANNRNLSHKDTSRLEVLQHVYMELLRQGGFASLATAAERVKFATALATRTAREFLRFQQRDCQLFDNETVGASVSLKCGGRQSVRDVSQDSDDINDDDLADAAGSHITGSRADWKLAHEYEDVMIARIDNDRAIARGEVKRDTDDIDPVYEPDAENNILNLLKGMQAEGTDDEFDLQYAAWVRILGTDDAAWLLCYGTGRWKRPSPYRGADHTKACRLKKKFQKAL
jgi:hypothetical protein